MISKLKVLFLCTGNSCRSQMAEGWARHLQSDRMSAYSAGTDPHKVDPRAVQVMKEAGVDISGYKSKNIKELEHVDFDLVITLCGHANGSCPDFPKRTKVVHVGFEDPPLLAGNSENQDEILMHYRRIRDEIRLFIQKFPASLPDDLYPRKGITQ